MVIESQYTCPQYPCTSRMWRLLKIPVDIVTILAKGFITQLN